MGGDLKNPEAQGSSRSITSKTGILKNFSDDPTMQPILKITSLEFYSY